MIDKQRVHDAADLHELLPLPTVTGKPRDLACRHGSHPSQADFGDHSLESDSLRAARRGSSEVLVDHLDLLPAEVP